MNSYIVSCSTLSDAALVQLFADAIRQVQEPLWVFVEGPTQCAFMAPTDVAHDTSQVERLWQVRLFTEISEIAARRRSFDEAQPWMVRWIAASAPNREGWSAPLMLPAGQVQSLVMYGRADETGQFHERRFHRAVLAYPGLECSHNDEAVLVTARHVLDDGPVIRWLRLDKYVAPEG